MPRRFCGGSLKIEEKIMWIDLLQAFGVSFVIGVLTSFFFVLCQEYSEPGGFVQSITALLSCLFFLTWLFVGLPELCDVWHQISVAVGLWNFMETLGVLFLLYSSLVGGFVIGTSPDWLFQKRALLISFNNVYNLLVSAVHCGRYFFVCVDNSEKDFAKFCYTISIWKT